MAKQGFLRDILAIVVGFGSISTKKPNLRCPQCRTEVVAPREDDLVLFVDHLEDFRKHCWRMWKVLRESELPLAPEHRAELLAKLERFLRFLEALTPDERLQPERVGEAERERARLASGTTAADVEQLFAEFESLRAAYEQARQQPGPPATPWYFVAPMVLGLLAAAGMLVWAQFDPGAATVLAALGYYFVAAVFVFMPLSFYPASRYLRSPPSWLRLFLFLILFPAAAGTALFVLAHDAVVRAGLGMVPEAFGCAAVMMWVITALFWVVTRLTVRKAVREARERLAKEKEFGVPAAP